MPFILNQLPKNISANALEKVAEHTWETHTNFRTMTPCGDGKERCFSGIYFKEESSEATVENANILSGRGWYMSLCYTTVLNV